MKPALLYPVCGMNSVSAAHGGCFEWREIVGRECVIKTSARRHVSNQTRSQNCVNRFECNVNELSLRWRWYDSVASSAVLVISQRCNGLERLMASSILRFSQRHWE